MEIIKLWEDVPGYVEGGETPVLEYYKAEKRCGNGTVVILPGGGYCKRAEHEGRGYAEFLNANGLDVFVLQYRVAPYRFPLPILDARRAMRYVRANAERYGIDPEKIAIMGSSAGGHLAEMTANYFDKIDGEGIDALDDVDFRPNAQILCYPVTDRDSHNGSYANLLGENDTEKMRDMLNPIKICSENTPCAFVWHTETDTIVKMESTLKYVAALHNNNVRCELHVYPRGWHGMGLAEADPIVRRWSEDLIVWLKYIGFINE